MEKNCVKFYKTLSYKKIKNKYGFETIVEKSYIIIHIINNIIIEKDYSNMLIRMIKKYFLLSIF